ncbi:hypothetical protein POM88_035876 [Heracleum sosnowskyi]|uniref:Uncharacterized protein n=1 Tax=Heracleum sosnowskyi TaxID=360622 RepID=A0AAD8MEH2_9APIA|nr:hypothetical protein POM88_035876 [Heracleum sosnowskyi]
MASLIPHTKKCQSTNPVTAPVPPAGDPSRSKSPRDDADEPTSGDFPPAAKRRVVLAQDVVFMIMLSSRQIGKLIYMVRLNADECFGGRIAAKPPVLGVECDRIVTGDDLR